MDNKINTADMSWNFFEKTGNIEAFLEYNEIKKIKSGEINEHNFPQRINNQRS